MHPPVLLLELWPYRTFHAGADSQRAMAEKRVLIGVTGSVAAIKIPELVQQLLQISSMKERWLIKFGVVHKPDNDPISFVQPQLDVQLVATKSALHFFDPTALPVKCHIDEEEWVRIKMYTVPSLNSHRPAPLQERNLKGLAHETIPLLSFDYYFF